MANQADHNADGIEVLSTAEGIGKRPALYLGVPATDPLAVTRLLQESLCLALDAVCCGAATHVAVTLHRDGSATVADDGPGLSLKPARDGRPEAEVMMTTLFACRDHKADRRVAEAACQVGMAVVNALSMWCVLTTFYEGGRWRQRYRRGVPEGPFTPCEGDGGAGTTVSFLPDPAVFGPAVFGPAAFDAGAFAAWVAGLGLRLDQVDMRLTDERAGPRVDGR